MQNTGLPNMMAKLVRELETGGFEKFFLNNGDEVLHYAYVLEEAHFYGADTALSALFWEAVSIVGPENVWRHPTTLATALLTLTDTDRANLRRLAHSVLDYIFDTDFMTDG